MLPCLRWALVIIVCFAAGCTTHSGASRKSEPAGVQLSFERYEAVTGFADRQTILTGFLLGGAIAELAVVNVDENADRRLHVLAFGDNTWVPRLNATLRPEVLFVDMPTSPDATA